MTHDFKEALMFLEDGQIEIHTLRAALKIAMKYQWQPIETAPKDGTMILVKTNDHAPCARLYYNISAGNWENGRSVYEEHEMIAWMPLPDTSEEVE